MTSRTEHIEEQLLSRFVLNDPSLTELERERIEKHFLVCEGCGKLYKEIKEFYAAAENELHHNPSLGERRKSTIVKKEQSLDFWSEPVSAIIPHITTQPIAKIWHFVKQRPVVSSIGVFGLFAALFFAVSTFQSKSISDTNPSYVQFEQQKLAVYNKSGEKLWQKPVTESFNLSISTVAQSKLVEIVDTDGDGKNEIVTVLKFLETGLKELNALLVFNADGSLKWKTLLGREVQLAEKKYPLDFRIQKLLVSTFEKKIFVIISHSHSPSAMYVLDFNGKIIGELWNYGHYQDFALSQSDSVITTILLDDNVNEPVIISLPTKDITGVQQLYFSTFLEIKKFHAQLYETRLKLNNAFSIDRSSFTKLQLLDSGMFSVHYNSESIPWLFTIIFNSNLEIDSILPTDAAIEKYGQSGVNEQTLRLKRSFVHRVWSKPPV